MVHRTQDRIPTERQRRRPQFTIKSALVTMLIVGLVAGWLTDRYRTQARLRRLIDEQTLRREHAEVELSQLSHWIANEQSLEDVPEELRHLIEEATPRTVDPEEGYRLFRVRMAEVTLAYAGLKGNSFRIRGGPLQYELLSEDLSGDEPQVVYRFVGPQGDPARNTDGVLTYGKPRGYFKPHRREAGIREPSGQEFFITFSQGSFSPIKIPAHEVWPEWIYTAEGVGGTKGSEISQLYAVMRENEPTQIFSVEMSAADGRRARVQLTVTCGPRTPDAATRDDDAAR